MKSEKITPLQLVLATAYGLCGLAFLVLLAGGAKAEINSAFKHEYTGPPLIIIGLLVLLVGAITQLKLSEAIIKQSPSVSWLSLIDLPAALFRALLLAALIWGLRRHLPVYFFATDACACENVRPIAQYHPLDQYYTILRDSLFVFIFAIVGLLPTWFFNYSKAAKRIFTSKI